MLRESQKIGLPLYHGSFSCFWIRNQKRYAPLKVQTVSKTKSRLLNYFTAVLNVFTEKQIQ